MTFLRRGLSRLTKFRLFEGLVYKRGAVATYLLPSSSSSLLSCSQSFATAFDMTKDDFSLQLDCHQLSEVRVCKRQSDCDTFHWRAGLWTACIVLNKTANCGAGVKRREAICVMSNQATEVIGREVPDWRCQGLDQPILEETCFRYCPKVCT